jgi:hypothetical protein
MEATLASRALEPTWVAGILRWRRELVRAPEDIEGENEGNEDEAVQDEV